MFKVPLSGICFFALFCFASAASAATLIPMYLVTKHDNGKYIGIISAQQTPYGVLLTPLLKDLSPGLHGFHLHTKPFCADNGLAAGGHFDPKHTGKHLGPYADGHLGDLPVMIVNKHGETTVPELAPRLKLTDLKGHALIIHEFGDNYADSPKPLGGGGPRIACGVVK